MNRFWAFIRAVFLWGVAILIIRAAIDNHNQCPSIAAFIPLLIAALVLLPPVRRLAAGYLPPFRTIFIVLGAFIGFGIMSGEDKSHPKEAVAIEAREEKSEAQSGQGNIAIAADKIESAPAASTSAEVDAQLHNPSLCGDTDIACIRAAYNEYKAGMLEEVDGFRQLENDVGYAFYARDGNKGNLISRQMMERNLYRHHRWKIPTNEQIIRLGIPFEEWESYFLTVEGLLLT